MVLARAVSVANELRRLAGREGVRRDHARGAGGSVSVDGWSALRGELGRHDLEPVADGGALEARGAVPLRGERAPGRGGPDGSDEWAAGRVGGARGPRFDLPLATDGYAWWYLDVVSDCGRWALVIIAMLGSPFSPYYARARRRGPTDPLDFVALNVALHGPSERVWVLNERRGATREAQSLAIGRSSLHLSDRGELEVRFDERAAPLPRRLAGTVRLVPEVLGPGAHVLDARADHRWWPVAPRARVEVTLTEPRISFSGSGYFDANVGLCPLEDTFRRWSWCRAATPGQGATIAYDAEERSGARRTFDLAIDTAGTREVEGRVDHHLGRTGWGLAREVRAEAAARVQSLRTLEDTPFYARSQIAIDGRGGRSVGIHESLCLDRFSAPWVQLLLPMKMRRVRDAARGGLHVAAKPA